MSAEIFDGRALALKIKQGLRRRRLRLAIIRGADDEASTQYRQAKIKACREAGMETIICAPAKLGRMARDRRIDAIIVELPPPPGIKENELLAALPPEKDAEGVSPLSFGRLMLARRWRDLSGLPLPCTASAVIRILKAAGVTVSGRQAVVVGRSNIVGKPVAQLLSLLGATVTLCHSRTRDLAAYVRRADILVAAAGRPGLIRGGWIKKGASVIDAGAGKGDVEFVQARRRAGLITPVPGGVGPVTTASLLANIHLLARR